MLSNKSKRRLSKEMEKNNARYLIISTHIGEIKYKKKETDAKPGWITTKTFIIENEVDEPFKYDIYIKDLVNTLVIEGFIQYKITSTS